MVAGRREVYYGRWAGWPGELHGCGRPIRFPDSAEPGVPIDALFLTWDEQQIAASEEAIRAVDPAGDYSRVVPLQWS